MNPKQACSFSVVHNFHFSIYFLSRDCISSLFLMLLLFLFLRWTGHLFRTSRLSLIFRSSILIILFFLFPGWTVLLVENSTHSKSSKVLSCAASSRCALAISIETLSSLHSIIFVQNFTHLFRFFTRSPQFLKYFLLHWENWIRVHNLHLIINVIIKFQMIGYYAFSGSSCFIIDLSPLIFFSLSNICH